MEKFKINKNYFKFLYLETTTFSVFLHIFQGFPLYLYTSII